MAGKFDPTKSGLLGYLKRAAERDLINVVQQGHRRRRGEELREDVEVSILARNKFRKLERDLLPIFSPRIMRLSTFWTAPRAFLRSRDGGWGPAFGASCPSSALLKLAACAANSSGVR